MTKAQSGIWMLSALSCWLLVAGAIRFDNEQSIHLDKHLLGESGEVCTRQGTKCISSAVCQEKRCLCPKDTTGDGTVDCVTKDEHLCTVTNDFEIRGFGASDPVTAVFPCPVRLTSFKVKSALPLTADPFPPSASSESDNEIHVHCGVEVLGVPSPSRGRNKIRGFVVRLGLDVPGKGGERQFFTVGGSAAGFSLNDVTWSAGSSKKEGRHWTGWDKGFELVSLGVNITGHLDRRNNFLVLDLLQCRTKVKLRVPDQFGRRQVPAITITAPPDATWDSAAKPEAEMDHGLCGLPGDSPVYWRLQAAARKEPLKRTAALSSTLSRRLAVSLAGTDHSCIDPPKTFHLCPPGRRDLAIRHCSPLLVNRPLTACLLKSSRTKNDYHRLLLTFHSCLSLVCFQYHSTECLDVDPRCFMGDRRKMKEMMNVCEKHGHEQGKS